MFKRESGITLVALIITIIILIILAAVSITAISQGHLIDWAAAGSANYIDAANKENQTISSFESWWSSADKAVNDALKAVNS